LHDAKGGISETAALAFSFVVCHVKMLVKEALKRVVVRLDLCL